MRTKLFFAIFLTFSSLYANTDFNPCSKTTLCLACEIPSGLTVSDLTGASATLSWNAVSGATKYTIEIEDEQNNPSTFHMEANVNGTSYAVTGLTNGVLYKFKVRTRCGSDKSDWSDWVFFTAGNGGGSGGGSGTCVVPTTLSAAVNGGSATLSWNKVSGATQYYIEVEDEQNVPSTFHLELAVQDSFYTVVGLQANVLYKFKVRTHCTGGQSDWSSWLFFNGNNGGGTGGGTGNCSTPGSTQVSNITGNTALLTWAAVPGVASYLLEIEREQAGAPWQITQMVSTNSFLLTGLSTSTKYKFKVRSNCGGGAHSDWTNWRKFKTAPSFNGTTGGSNLNSPITNREEGQSALATSLDLQVWPNPVQNSATVRLQNLSAEAAILRLYNLAGRIIETQHIQAESGTWEGILSLQNLPNGLYLLQTQNGVKSQTIKLIVNH
ncbi:MAG: fibronectin type III domain-containing protein [Lewinellaceae bacterium]|nr:fibronectin type III domain-containing protein [Lewinellaceae bacterium]